MKPPTAAKKKLNAIIEAEGKSRDGAEDENEEEEGEWGVGERGKREFSIFNVNIESTDPSAAGDSQTTPPKKRGRAKAQK